MSTAVLMAFMLAASMATAQRGGEELAAFEKGVATSFKALVPAALARTRYRELNKEEPAQKAVIDKRWSEALTAFKAAVAEYWPYDDEQLTDEQQEYREALRELNTLFSRAKVGGRSRKISRENAIRLMMEIGERYPGSEAMDKAYHLIGHLYSDVEPEMTAAAQQMYARCANLNGPLSAFRIRSMVNVASVEADAAKRLQDRQALLNELLRLRDPAVLSDQLIRPLPVESQQIYVDRIIGTLTNIEAYISNTSANMVTDARRSPDAQDKINRLLERAQDETENPYIQKEAERLGVDEPLVPKSAEE